MRSRPLLGTVRVVLGVAFRSGLLLLLPFLLQALQTTVQLREEIPGNLELLGCVLANIMLHVLHAPLCLKNSKPKKFLRSRPPLGKETELFLALRCRKHGITITQLSVCVWTAEGQANHKFKLVLNMYVRTIWCRA